MLNLHIDCGFDTEDELIDYVVGLRDIALFSDDDDVVSSFAQDLSTSYSEVTESIDGASLYIEYLSPEPLNLMREEDGYSMEATIVSPELVFWDPGYIDEDEEWETYFEFKQSEEYFAGGKNIALKHEVNPISNKILSSLIYTKEEFCLNDGTCLFSIEVGLAKPGLNLSETNFSQGKWVFRLFGKISAIVKANSIIEAKSEFSKVIKDSFSFIECDYGTNKFSLHEFTGGEEKEIISEDSFWLIPIDHVFVNFRRPLNS